jgi:2-oxoisovalerate dehydrogenase E1 component
MNTDLSISAQEEQIIFDQARLIRAVENRLLKSFSDNEISGTIHTCIGQELTGVIISRLLKSGDSVFSNHRCHGHFLAMTDCITGLVAEIYGKASGVCAGRGGSQHLYKNGFYSNGIQGGIVPVAAGIAFAKKIKRQNEIAVVFIGDGTLGEGVVYETLNIIAKWEIPLLIVLENNLYAQSTHQYETLSGSILDRARAFGIESTHGDIWHWQALYRRAEDIVRYVRENNKPAFLQIDCYRLKAHSKGDDNRDRSEIETFEKMDPLNQRKLSHASDTHLPSPMAVKLEQAIKQARSDSLAPLREVLSQSPDIFADFSATPPKHNERIVSHLNRGLIEIMTENERVLVIGEDIVSPYGGAFKVTHSLSDRFPGRVINTPISEAALVGIGSGLALEGYLPIVEIMFGDFITLAFDQILNHASKFRYMYNEQVSVPLIIRCPMGGHRGYGPTHSQTLDKHFLGIPGLNVYAINSLFDPALLYQSLTKNSKDPSLVIENKVLYSQKLNITAPQGFQFIYRSESAPTVLVVPDSDHVDLTIVAYGGVASDVLLILHSLFYTHDLIAQFICPVQIYPFDLTVYQDYISKADFLFVLEEGQGFCGFASEIISQLVEQGLNKELTVRRLSAAPSPIPAAKALESLALPGSEDILKLIIETCNEKNIANA